MSDAYGAARTLARSLRESREFQGMRRLAASLRADPGSEGVLAQFRLAQVQLQAQSLQGQGASPEQAAALQRLAQQIGGNPTLRAYMEAEQAYGALLGEVQQILAEVFDPELPGAIG